MFIDAVVNRDKSHANRGSNDFTWYSNILSNSKVRRPHHFGNFAVSDPMLPRGRGNVSN